MKRGNFLCTWGKKYHFGKISIILIIYSPVYRSRHWAAVLPTIGAIVLHWVGISLARCSSFSSSYNQSINIIHSSISPNFALFFFLYKLETLEGLTLQGPSSADQYHSWFYFQSINIIHGSITSINYQ